MATTPTPAAASNATQSFVRPGSPFEGRLLSLDLFRGITIAFMILVNDAGDGAHAYAQLEHAAWNGWTLTDLVFPSFLFIVGVAMVFAFEARRRHGDSTSVILGHVLRRSFLILLIGLAITLYGHRWHIATLRYYGVLQRIASCYLVATLLTLRTTVRQQVAIIATCLIGYWLLMRFVPVPGLGMPVRDIPLLDPDRNIVAWLDRKLLFGHLYEKTRDPEGLLSTIPALATTMIGFLTGTFIRSSRSRKRTAVMLVLAGVAGVAAGLAWNPWFPINKKLWTSSYVLFAAGAALLCLALCYWLLDVKGWRGRWTMPFDVFGKNSILAYTVAELIAIFMGQQHITWGGRTTSLWSYVYLRGFAGHGTPANTSLLFSLTFVLVCWVPLYFCYRRKLFLKL